MSSVDRGPRAPRAESAGGTPERLVPERMGGRIIHAEHIARYLWAARFVSGQEVLDAGCGVGYGALMLRQEGRAERVVGVDNSPTAIAQAAVRAPDLEFLTGDLQELPLETDSFGVVVCFEVLEHLVSPGSAVAELRRVLRPGGLAIFSTPNARVHPQGNEHHVEELTPERLEAVLLGEFNVCRLQRQHLWAATLIGDDRALESDDPAVPLGAQVHKLSARPGGRETFTLALCSDAPLPAPAPLVMLSDTYEIRLWQERLDELRTEMQAAHHELEASRAREALSTTTARRTASTLHELTQENAELRQSLRDQSSLAAAHQAELIRSSERLEQAQHAARMANRWLEIIQSSDSWRITHPLRVGLGLVRQILRRDDPAMRGMAD